MTLWAKVTEWGLYVTLFVSLLLFGASFVEGYTLLEGLVVLLAASLLLQGTFLRPFFSTKKVKLSFFILIGWAVFLCAQLVPLPLSLVQFLSPRLIELYQTFGPMSLADTGVIPLSVAWEGGFRELGKYFAYAALFFISY